MEASLYLVHCGYYDPSVSDGLYESHTNVFVIASSFDDARIKAKALPEMQKIRMHIDGIQKIEAVQGFRLQLQEDSSLNGESRLLLNKHRELAPAKPSHT